MNKDEQFQEVGKLGPGDILMRGIFGNNPPYLRLLFLGGITSINHEGNIGYAKFKITDFKAELNKFFQQPENQIRDDYQTSLAEIGDVDNFFKRNEKLQKYFLDGLNIFYSKLEDECDILTIPELTSRNIVFSEDDLTLNMYLMFSMPNPSEISRIIYESHQRLLQGEKICTVDRNTLKKKLSEIVHKVNVAYKRAENNQLYLNKLNIL